MKKLWTSSALFLGTLAVLGLIYLGIRGQDVAMPIATIVIGIAGARGYEASKIDKKS